MPFLACAAETRDGVTTATGVSWVCLLCLEGVFGVWWGVLRLYEGGRGGRVGGVIFGVLGAIVKW